MTGKLDDRITFLGRKLCVFLLTVWTSATLIFIIPRLAPGDPIAAMIARMSQQSGYVENADKIIEGWRERFGLNDPPSIQYVRYLGNLFHFDLGYSMASFPATVSVMIGRALPWTVGLSLVSILATFLIGNFVGALLAWQKTPRWIKLCIPPTMIFTSIPGMLAAVALLYIFSFQLHRWLGLSAPLFPLRGAYGRGLEPGVSWPFILSVIHHGILPVTSIVLVRFGYWALGMRGMMITVEGEDYMHLARAKGLRPFYILYHYMIRNAILPQITGLALSLGTMVGGQVLVEIIFSYPGMGTLIYTAVRNQDFPVIQGATFIIIVGTATAVLLIDLLYPLIDPRISHQGK